VSIVGNTFWKGVQYDLRVEDSSHVVVGPNVFDRNPRSQDDLEADKGVLFRNCHDSTLTGLHIVGVRRKEAGLILRDCRRLNVTGCTVLDCQGAGILLDSVVASRLSDCLVDGPGPEEGPWRPLLISDDCEVLLSDNLLGQPVPGETASPAAAK
jgi:hypothetical protein